MSSGTSQHSRARWSATVTAGPVVALVLVVVAVVSIAQNRQSVRLDRSP